MQVIGISRSVEGVRQRLPRFFLGAGLNPFYKGENSLLLYIFLYTVFFVETNSILTMEIKHICEKLEKPGWRSNRKTTIPACGLLFVAAFKKYFRCLLHDYFLYVTGKQMQMKKETSAVHVNLCFRNLRFDGLSVTKSISLIGLLVFKRNVLVWTKSY